MKPSSQAVHSKKFDNLESSIQDLPFQAMKPGISDYNRGM